MVQPNNDAKFYQGGSANSGRRFEGREPTKRRRGLAPVQLTKTESAIVETLRHIIGLHYDIRSFERNEKFGELLLWRDERHFSFLPEKSEFSYTRRTGIQGIPGVTTVETQDEALREEFPYTVKIHPQTLIEYLQSEPVQAVLGTIRAHEEALPAAMDSEGHHHLLAGLSSPFRAMLVDLEVELGKLSKEMTLAGRAGNKAHDGIATHESTILPG